MLSIHLEPERKNHPLPKDTARKENSAITIPYVYLSDKKCPTCGNLLMIPSGTCHVCQVCGTSLGCS